MATAKRKNVIALATFPVCQACGAHKVPRVSDAPIYVQVDEQPSVLIPRSQEAAALRFLWRTHAPVLWGNIYQAIGSHEVSRCLTRLRKKWGIPIPCDDAPKRSKPGTQGAFSLGRNVKVWEPVEGEGNHGAA